MKKLVLLQLILMLFYACSDKNSPQGELIDVGEIHYDEWFSLMEVDSLILFEETLAAPQLSIAKKCIVGTERILFWDYRAKLVYVYGTNGNYLFTTGGIGRATDEYVDLNDVAFSSDQSEILLLDKTGLKAYDARDGRFLYKKEFEGIETSSIKGFASCMNNEYLLFTPEKEYSIYKVDSNNRITPLRKRNGYQMIYPRFSPVSRGCVILPDYGQFSIDMVQDDKIIPKYSIELGHKGLPSDLIPKDFKHFEEVDNMKEYFKVILNYYENDDALYMSMVGPSQTYYDLLYNKKDHHVYVGPNDKKTNLVITGMDDSYIYGLLYLDYVAPDSPLYPALSSCMERNSHNPVIARMKLFGKSEMQGNKQP